MDYYLISKELTKLKNLVKIKNELEIAKAMLEMDMITYPDYEKLLKELAGKNDQN